MASAFGGIHFLLRNGQLNNICKPVLTGFFESKENGIKSSIFERRKREEKGEKKILKVYFSIFIKFIN